MCERKQGQIINNKHKKEMMLDEVLGKTCKFDENKME